MTTKIVARVLKASWNILERYPFFLRVRLTSTMFEDDSGPFGRSVLAPKSIRFYLSLLIKS